MDQLWCVRTVVSQGIEQQQTAVIGLGPVEHITHGAQRQVDSFGVDGVLYRCAVDVWTWTGCDKTP